MKHFRYFLFFLEAGMAAFFLGGSVGFFPEQEIQTETEYVLHQTEAPGAVPVRKEPETPAFSWNDHSIIAHALGGLDGYAYLNCPEGFRNAYENGCRLFEVDLTKTSDGYWVCRHSWTETYGQWGDDQKGKHTLEEFLNAPLYGRYTPITFQDFLHLMQEYPDAYALLDTKHYSFRNYQSTLQDYADLAVLADEAGALDVLDRVIPEIYNEAMFSGTSMIHDFPQFVFSFWKDYSSEELQEIASFCLEFGIGAVTVSRQYWTPDLQKLFQENGIRVYVYTVNDIHEAAGLTRIGFDGIVTDILFPNGN